ncbi:MAG: undecaprenyl/decaprenyl-phosphate alpha-N-acetylglucosaminyl 1-phosphate transferase, partial [Lentisphaerae bacterium]|nr:undecaprenyl/decaprenyl-phosphate alpha-N-acetylglucosaminyl 1-phosphate transferase [Lentisphaerota bacterium]
MTHVESIGDIVIKTLPYWGVLVGAMSLSLALTPLVCAMNRRLGMVDRPGGRRINKSPIPRGGGVAVIASFSISLSALALLSERAMFPSLGDDVFWKLMLLSIGIGGLGFIDDRFGMRAIIKLAGQIVIASLVYFWCGIGFHCMISFVPWWLDVPLTVFWITGAINAFNLIDGLDGLASGLAVIAATGMAGTLFFVES